jgi:hypothetical protein
MRRIKCLRTSYDSFYEAPVPGDSVPVPGRSRSSRSSPLVKSGKFKGLSWAEARAKITLLIKELAMRVEKVGTLKQKLAAQSHAMHVDVSVPFSDRDAVWRARYAEVEHLRGINPEKTYAARKAKRDAKRAAERAELSKLLKMRRLQCSDSESSSSDSDWRRVPGEDRCRSDSESIVSGFSS